MSASLCKDTVIGKIEQSSMEKNGTVNAHPLLTSVGLRRGR